MADYKFEKTYNEIVGITKDHRIVILDHIFEYSDNFKGATRYEMRVLTQNEIDNLNDVDNAKEELEGLWREAVGLGETRLGLEDYTKDLLDNLDGNLYFLYDDPSFRSETDKAYDKLNDEQKATFDKIIGVRGKDFVDWSSDCCGRIGQDYKSWDWEVLFRPDLLEVIAEYEG